MSDLYVARVLARDDSVKFEPSPWFTERWKYELGELLEMLDEQAPSAATFQQLVEGAQAFAQTHTYDELLKALSYDPNQARAAPPERDPCAPSNSSVAIEWVCSAVLERIYPGRHKTLCTSRITLEVAAQHPDTGVPTSWVGLAPFAVRLLAEASGDLFTNPIWRYFEGIGPEALLTLPSRPVHALDVLHDMVVDMGVDQRVVIEPSDVFFERHSKSWWAHERDILDWRSYPFEELQDPPEAVRLWIRVQPDWIQRLVSGTFKSRAY